jgi:ribosomal protein S18 acetylase RimI-like enzyme
MLIRPATPTDVIPLAHLAQETYTQAFGHSFSPADLAAHLAHQLAPQNFEYLLTHDTILLAEVDGQLVGYVQFGRGDGTIEGISPDAQELRRLYVQARYQNQGLGAQLMRAALDHPTLKNTDVYLDVWEHNQGAQRFYARYDFKVIGTREFVVESGAETSLDLIMLRPAT